MKIRYRQPSATADISAARAKQRREWLQLVILTLVTLSVIHILVGFLVNFLVAGVSFEREAQMFAKLRLPSVAMETKAMSLDERERIEKLQRIVTRLSVSDKVPPLPYSVVIIDAQAPNAFAFPGGTIGVTRGLLAITDRELELAFVLGHELGHYRNRDHLRGLGRALGFGAIYALIFGQTLDTGSVISSYTATLDNAYSRRQEIEADKFGLAVLAEQYGAVEGFDTLFQHLQAQERAPNWAQLFATHPAPEDRIRRLREHLQYLKATPR